MTTARVEWLERDDLKEWDAFVEEHPLGVIYHSAAWGRVLEAAFPHIRASYLVLRDGDTGAIQAGLPICTVKSWWLGNRVVSMPFSSFCDPLVSSAAQMGELLPSLLAFQRETGSKRLELRTIRTSAWMPVEGVSASRLYRHHYLPLDREPEALAMNFGRTAIRRWFSRAPRKGVKVTLRHDEAAVRTFHRILVLTRRRLGLPPIPLAFFESLRAVLGPEGLAVFLAMREEEMTGGLLALKFKQVLHLEYSADTPGSYQTGANQLLHWEAIKHAWAQGCKSVSFGRTSSSNTGLLEYKRRWATKRTPS